MAKADLPVKGSIDTAAAAPERLRMAKAALPATARRERDDYVPYRDEADGDLHVTSADLLFDVLLSGCVVLGSFLVGYLRAQRRCRRENARRQADYRAACIRAKRDGQPPPFPPNELRWGRH
jgi:hypothetical protein